MELSVSIDQTPMEGSDVLSRKIWQNLGDIIMQNAMQPFCVDDRPLEFLQCSVTNLHCRFFHSNEM
jgi:hypothetical protein